MTNKKRYHNAAESYQTGTMTLDSIDVNGGGSGIETGPVYIDPGPVIDNGPVDLPPAPVDMPPAPPDNQVPQANPGVNQTITLPADTIQLDGSKSYDPENGPLDFRWTLENGPTNPAIVNAGKAIATVAGLEAGNYGFRLTVTDGMGATDTGLVYITVEPPAAGPAATTAGTAAGPTAAPAGGGAGSTNTVTAPVLTTRAAPYQTSYSAPAGPVETPTQPKRIDWLFWIIVGSGAAYIIFAKNE